MDYAIRVYKKKPLSESGKQEYEAFKKKYREAGPVKFAEEVLKIDPNTGEKLVLSDDQKEFLEDFGFDRQQFGIIAAGRGCGKTFAIAIYVLWRILCFDYYNLSCMGGSSDQSEIIQRYITGWRINSPIVNKYIVKDIHGEVKSASLSSCFFLSCSATSTRGEHVREFIVDEEASGEEAGGGEFIQAALFQVSTSKHVKIIKSSTMHYIHGDFLWTWNNAEKLGYKRYLWSLARHKSGIKDIYAIYQDKNPDNWFSNVPWVVDETIRVYRRQFSDEKFLVEILGGVSMTSGLVFNPTQLSLAICNECKECTPYTGNCHLIQKAMRLSKMPEEMIPPTPEDCLHHVVNRVMGIDWGHVSPTAYCILGQFKDYILVLHAEEQVGLTDRMQIERAVELAKKFYVSTIRPDPSHEYYNNELRWKGLAVHEVFAFEGGKEKDDYLFNLKKYFERHTILIPAAFTDLIRSLRNLTFNKKGKIMKKDDHSFDALLYGSSHYAETVNEIGFWGKEPKIADPFKKR